MNKNAIKKFATEARRELISRVSQRAVQYGISDQDIGNPNDDSVGGHLLSATEKKQRAALIERIEEKGYEQVMEEVAYTWFNRFIALRFMEVNGYLPTRVRVFTDENNTFKPQILTEAIHMDLDGLDMEKVYTYKDANEDEALYKYLLITQCNALNRVLPGMFQKIADYTELLFPDNLMREGSVIRQMVELIPEEDWKDQVQMIGWLYQYYNSEKKDDVFAALKKNVKITKENIPAATQLFTPDWIVRYMVENSLGRLWVEGHPNDALKSQWKYYLEEAEQEPDVQVQLAEIRKEYAELTPEQIKVIDPCCGSGHILAYLFDVLMQIYETYGYTTREAVAGIVENNLYGLDIDDRAAQLAYFSVMMKARQYDRRFFSRGIQPHVYAIAESNHVDGFAVEYFVGGDAKRKAAMDTIIEELHDAKEYGSILTVTPQDWSVLYERFAEIEEDVHLSRDTARNELLPLVQVAEALAQKYDVVVTNPPYMGSSGMGAKLSQFVKKNYPDSKSDLFAVFIERCGQMTERNGYQAMITQHAWMFLSSFEKLRTKLLLTDIVNMAHLGARAFEEIGGEVVQTTSFVIRKSHIADYKGEYCRLIEPTTQQGKEDMFLAGKNRYEADQSNFSKIPGSPVAYWVSKATIDCFNLMPLLGDQFTLLAGTSTGDNTKYQRFWSEVEYTNISRKAPEDLSKRWYPCNTGGNFKKYTLNDDYVIDWENDGYRIKHQINSRGKIGSAIRNKQYFFVPGITWNKLSSSNFGVRLVPSGFISDDTARMIVCADNKMLTLLGFLCSKVCKYFLQILSPTMSFTNSELQRLPIAEIENSDPISKITKDNVTLSDEDRVSFETNWDFQRHPMISVIAKNRMLFDDINSIDMAECFICWKGECEDRFQQLKANEEELNRIFIDIYGLQDELTPEVEDKDVTVRKADLGRDIRSFISYAVGCMFGRYSPYKPGLIYAGGDWDAVYGDFPIKKIELNENIIHGTGFHTYGCPITDKSVVYLKDPTDMQDAEEFWGADADNIIPICDDEYFEDDIVGRFVEFVRIVYGSETLEENLRFIADALGGKGQPKDVIRNYFLNDFYKDHCKMYQKRPIYWMFESGKKNGFKCLVYMHRYQPDTIARIRTDYVHEQQSRYRTAIEDVENRIANASAGERVKLNKQLKTLNDKASEIHTYEEIIHHLADQMISIDLDDGVKKNYAIFQDVLAKIK